MGQCMKEGMCECDPKVLCPEGCDRGVGMADMEPDFIHESCHAFWRGLHTLRDQDSRHIE